MNLLERAIALVSPKTAASRARYRMAVQHFDGAATTYRQKNWKAPSGDVNAVARGAIGVLRRRSRDMVRNNAIARRAVDAIVNNVVGDGIIPHVESDDKVIKAEIEDLLAQHLDTTLIDAGGMMNLYGLQRLAMRSIVESGEAIWLQRARRVRDGLPLNFQIEMLESEYLDDRAQGRLDGGGFIADGIETTAIGKRAAYRLFDAHPESDVRGFPTSRRVLASRVIHSFNIERPGQMRGVPWLAPVMSMTMDAYDFADAQLLRQKIANLFVGFVRDVHGEGMDVNATGGTSADNVDSLFPGMFEHLPPGRDVTFSDPPKAEGASEYMSSVLHMIASGLGLTFEALSMQLGEVNFSSARMGRLEMNRMMSAHQWTLFIPQICNPLEVWLRQFLEDHVTSQDYRIAWTPPRFEMVDPAREVPPMVEMIDNGLTSRSHVIRSMGFDPEKVDKQRVEDMEREEGLGLSMPAPDPEQFEQEQGPEMTTRGQLREILERQRQEIFGLPNSEQEDEDESAVE